MYFNMPQSPQPLFLDNRSLHSFKEMKIRSHAWSHDHHKQHYQYHGNKHQRTCLGDFIIIIIILDLCSTYYHPGNHHHHPGSFYSLLCTIVLWDYDRYNQNLICSKLIYDISNKQLLTYEDFIYHLFKTYYLKLSHVCQLCTFFGLMERIIFNPKIMCNVRTLYSPCVTDQNYKSNTSICEKGQWRCALSWDPILHSVGKLRRAR